jgi:hypothetical protein
MRDLTENTKTLTKMSIISKMKKDDVKIVNGQFKKELSKFLKETQIPTFNPSDKFCVRGINPFSFVNTLYSLPTTINQAAAIISEVEEKQLVSKASDILDEISSITKPIVTTTSRVSDFLDYISNTTNSTLKFLYDSFIKFISCFSSALQYTKEALFSFFLIDYLFDSDYFKFFDYNSLKEKISSLFPSLLSFFEPLLQFFRLFKFSVPSLKYHAMSGESCVTPYFLLSVAVFSQFFFGSTKLDFITLLNNNFKSFNAFASISDNFERTIPYIFKCLPSFIIHAFQQHVPSAYEQVVLRYLDKSVHECISKLSHLVSNPDSIYYSSHNLYEFFSLKKQFDDLLTKYVRDAPEGQEFQIFRHPSTLDMAGEMAVIYSECLRRGLVPGSRIEPTVVWLCGEPGVGKSLLKTTIASHFIPQGIPYSQYVYDWKSNIDYQDGYNHQPITVLDDYLQTTEAVEEDILIYMMNTADYPLNVSSVDKIDMGMKGEVRFTSKLIIITSNMTLLQNSSNIRSVDAFNRRRDLVFNLRKTRGMKFDDYDYTHLNISQLDPLSASGSGTPICNYKDLIDLVSLKLHEKTMRGRRIIDRNLNLSGKSSIRSSDVVDPESDPILSPLLEQLSPTDESSPSDNTIIKRSYAESVQALYSKTRSKVLDIYRCLESQLNRIDRDYVLGGIFKVSQWLSLISVFYSTASFLFPAISSYFCPATTLENYIQSIPSGDNITTKKLPKRAALRLKINGHDRVLYDIPQSYSEISERLYKISTWIEVGGRPVIRTLNCFQSGVSSIIFPKHLIYRGTTRISDGDTIVLSRGGSHAPYKFAFHESRCEEFPNEDIVRYNLTGTKHLYRKKNMNSYFFTAHPKSAKALLVSLSQDGTHKIEYQTSSLTYDAPISYEDNIGVIQHYELPSAITFKSKLTDGDCGSLVTVVEDGFVKIVGFLVAGNHDENIAQPLYPHHVKECKNIPIIKSDLYAPHVNAQMVSDPRPAEDLYSAYLVGMVQTLDQTLSKYIDSNPNTNIIETLDMKALNGKVIHRLNPEHPADPKKPYTIDEEIKNVSIPIDHTVLRSTIHPMSHSNTLKFNREDDGFSAKIEAKPKFNKTNKAAIQSSDTDHISNSSDLLEILRLHLRVIEEDRKHQQSKIHSD